MDIKTNTTEHDKNKVKEEIKDKKIDINKKMTQNAINKQHETLGNNVKTECKMICGDVNYII